MDEKKLMIPSSFGSLSAIIDYPKKDADKLAILCPGYLDTKDYAGLARLANTLAKEGYTTVRFDPTGVWESDGDISQYTTTQYLKDVKNVLSYMLQQKNYNYILIGGHSRGATIALLYAAIDSRVSIVIGIMPSSRPKMGKSYSEWKKKGFSISYRDLPENRSKRRMFKVPVSHFEDYLKYDKINEIKKVKIPIILIGGRLDTINPPRETKELFDNANEPKIIFIIPNIGHDYRHSIKEVKIVNAEILKLMKEIRVKPPLRRQAFFSDVKKGS